MPITVAEMIERLSVVRQDAFVVLSTDEEGNWYNYFSGYTGQGSYSPESHELLMSESQWKEEEGWLDDAGTYGEYLESKGAVPAVILWP